MLRTLTFVPDKAQRFCSIYNTTIFAVARNGEQIDPKIGDIKLGPGDTLLMVSQTSFAEQQRNSRDCYLLSSLNDTGAVRHGRAPVDITSGTLAFGLPLTLLVGLMTLVIAPRFRPL